MKTLIRLICFCLVISALPGVAPARANPVQAFDNAWKFCARETARRERRTAIPKGLLKAISLAESGRWDELNRENVAWPWTVTAKGQGRFFDTKAEAVAEVEFLMTEGVRNIDVGCMQVNLYYHDGAFESLEEALDPRANKAYAAAYLKNMYSATGDWTDAAGYYHSTTPERNGPYKEKVLAFWRPKGGPADAGAGGRKALRYAPIDHIRMARLNGRFKARLESQRQPSGPASGKDALAAFREKQLSAWRNARSRGIGLQHLVAMRQAELVLKRKREMDRLTKGDPKTRFQERRLKQLRDWRRRVAGKDLGTGTKASAP